MGESLFRHVKNLAFLRLPGISDDRKVKFSPNVVQKIHASQSSVFYHNAIRAWNMLPLHIRQCSSVHSFRNALGTNAISRQLAMDYFILTFFILINFVL